MNNNHCCCGSSPNENGCRKSLIASLKELSVDSTPKTILVAIVLCLVCSLAVSWVSIGLRPMQAQLRKEFREKNIFLASGLSDSDAKNLIYSKIVNFEKGVILEDKNLEDLPIKGGETEATKSILKEKDLANLKFMPENEAVYFVKDNDDEIKKLILPIKGSGAWSTLYGFLVINRQPTAPDNLFYNEIDTIMFYEQGETPGLGGEVENPRWRAGWRGKKISDINGNLEIEVIKAGTVVDKDKSRFKIDGLSGATVTSRYVSRAVRFWLGDDGFGRFIKNLREMEASK